MDDDPKAPTNCPKCGKSLVYLYTASETLFYRCDRDGIVISTPDGAICLDDLENSARR